MPTIAFDVTAETKAMVRKIQQLEGHVGRLQQRLRGTGTKGATGFQKTTGAIRNMTAAMVGAQGITGAVMRVVGTVKEAYAEMLAEHRKFLGNIEKTSDAKAKFLYNAMMGGMFGGDKNRLQKWAEGAASEAGVGLPEMYEILSTAVSAGGDASPDAIRNAAVLAGRGQRAGLGPGSTLVGAALDLREITGKDDATANMAFASQIGAASRATTLEAQMQLVRGLQALKLSGDTAESAGEMAAAINMMMKDEEGAKSATAIVNLATRLKQLDLAPTETVDARTGKRKTEWGALAGESTAERLRNLQTIYGGADEDTQKAILKRIGGRAAFKPALEAMLGDTDWWQDTLATMQQKIQAPGAPAAGERWGQYWQAMGTGGEGLTSTVRTARAALEKDATLGRGREATKAAAMELAQGWMKQQGFWTGMEAKAESVLSFGQRGIRGFDQPEYWRRMVERTTPEDRKGTEAYRELIASFQDLQKQYTVATLKEAGMDRLAGSIDRMTAAAEKLAASTGRRTSQDVD